VKNFGRTPAFVSQVVTNSYIGAPLPKIRKLANTNQPFVPVVIESRDSHDFIGFEVRRHAPFTPEHIDAFLAEDDPWLYVYGLVTFTDFQGSPHEQGFVFLFIPKSGNWTVPQGREEYKNQS
jgi:hypothetical protein